MIKENISNNDLQNPFKLHLTYVNEIKQSLIKAYDANEKLISYFEDNHQLVNRLSFIYDELEKVDKILNDEFRLDEEDKEDF